MTSGLGIGLALAAVLAASITAGCGEGDADSDGLPPVSKTLKVGQPATVTYEDSTKKVKSTAELTPTAIEKRSIGDLAAIDLEPSEKSSTPYFVKVRCRNVSPGPIRVDNSVCSLSAVDDRDERHTPLTVIGGFDRCSADDDPKRLKKGESYDTCGVYLIPEGAALASLEDVEFLGYGPDKDGKRFVWKQ